MTTAPPPATALPAPVHTLVCHVATPSVLPLQIGVELALASTPDGPGLLLHYEVWGDISHLRLPAAVAAPGPADGLWQHTCFEAFVGMAGDPAYREFNFSPSGQWAAYRFRAERQRDATAEAIQTPVVPSLHLEYEPQRLVLRAWLPLNALPEPAQALDIGLTAVIENADGQLSYWALHHPAPRPDFHHPAGRSLALALPLPSRTSAT